MVYGKPWNDQKQSSAQDGKHQEKEWSKIKKAGIIAGVAGTTAVAWPLALGAAGFGAGGVAAGSFAAGIQAGIGNVAAGSAFAFLQSAGAGGAAAGVINGIVGGAGAVSVLATGFGGGNEPRDKTSNEQGSDGNGGCEKRKGGK